MSTEHRAGAFDLLNSGCPVRRWNSPLCGRPMPSAGAPSVRRGRYGVGGLPENDAQRSGYSPFCRRILGSGS